MTIKLLFLAANPQDTTRLQIDHEKRAIDQALRMTTYHERFELYAHDAVHYSDLQDLLLRYQPHIVHFSGHGSSAGELLLEGANGVHPVSAEALSTLFATLKDNIRCVVLNACYSQVQAQAIANHIDCVIGMANDVNDIAAINFATAYYRAMGYGRNLKDAFDLGCNAIKLANLADNDLPQLLALRSDPSQIVLMPTVVDREVDHTAPTPGQSPFKGLQFFDVADASLFFGREQLTADLVACLHHHRFLAVLGASGSGKSSSVRAGLVPALQRGESLPNGILPPKGSDQWPIYILTPKAHPLKELATCLTPDSESDLDRARLIDELAQSAGILDLRVSRLLRRGLADRLLLVVDQFEELFTLCRNPQERQAFIDNLLTAAVDDGVTTVVITLRADFYHRCADFVNLRLALQEHQVYIGPMSEDELRQAIEEPARAGGWELEAGLVDLLLDDVAAQPGALPLLSHALLETWKRRRGRTLTLAGYAASGRVQGAIAQTAEAVLYQQLTAEQRPIARNIFVRLTELGEGVQDTRRRVALAELMPANEKADLIEKVLQVLANARLITIDHNEVEVAHEALIREWATLRKWLADNREGLRIHRQLTEAAQQWRANHYDSSDLLRGNRLGQVQEWASVHGTDLNRWEQSFLQASQDEADALVQRETAFAIEREANRQRELENQRQLVAEQKRRTQLFRNWSIIAGVLLLIALIAAGASFYLNEQLNDKNIDLSNSLVETKRLAHVALSRQLAAQSTSELSKNHYDLAILLAIESAKVTSTFEAFIAIRASIATPWHSQAVFYGHTDSVNAAVWSQDESRILTNSVDGTARIWNVATGQELVKLEGHSEWVSSARWSQDESKILTSGHDGTARIWDAATGKELVKFEGHTNWVASAVWNQDESKILTSGADGTARIWDVATGKELIKFEGHTNWVRSAVWNQDESKVLTSGIDGTARIWDVTTGKELFKLEGHSGWVSFAKWNQDGSRILTGSDDGIARVWDAATGTELAKLEHLARVNTAVWNQDESKILTSSDDGTARIWEAITGRELVKFIGHTFLVNAAVWSQDESRILTSSDDGTARIWDVATRKELVKLEHSQNLKAAVWNQDESKILTSSTDGTARIWDASAGKEFVKLENIANVNEAMWSQDESKILTSSDDGTARIWDASAGRELVKLEHTKAVNSAMWNQDESKILTSSTDGTARIWDATTGKELVKFEGHTGWINSLLWNQDESKVLTSGVDNTARIWDAGTGTELVKLEGHTEWVASAVWNQDESKILTRSADGTARIWDAGTGTELVKLQHTKDINSVSWNQDESKILTSSADGTARIWDAATGTELVKLEGHTERVASAVWNQNESKILTRSDDGTARIWDAVTGTELVKLQHIDNVNNAMWNQDESKILTSSDDGTARIWDATTGTELVKFKGHTKWVNSVLWNQDESKILTSGHDGTARIWDASTGTELVKLGGHMDSVWSAVWNQNESMVLTYGNDGTVRIWYMDVKDLLTAACNRVPRNLTWNEWEVFIGGVYYPTCPSAPLPPDAIIGIQEEARTQIRAGQIRSGTQRLEQLNGWLKENGQFRNYGVDVSVFVTEVGATSTVDAIATLATSATTTPLQPLPSLRAQPIPPLAMPTNTLTPGITPATP